jgi:hypothetical protein
MKIQATSGLRFATISCWVVAAGIVIAALVLHPNPYHTRLLVGALFALGGAFILLGTLGALKRNSIRGTFFTATRQVSPISFWASIIIRLLFAIAFFIMAMFVCIHEPAA